ncbi:MAG: Mut7-C RNAse domain-containing protein [Methanobacteriota archaeon]|nr:MAG: Mut7-C RNAse domain-containing protein [Euryarchaeota archaeon]
MTAAEERTRFAADSMLGSLARWLRMLGYDTAYQKDLDDGALVQLARDEKRRILTRDRLLSKQPDSIYIESDDLDSQLRLVNEACELVFDEAEIRCSACNGDLAEVAKGEIEDQVPKGAFDSNDRFWKCADCGKIYWRGSHWLGILERFRKLNLA